MDNNISNINSAISSVLPKPIQGQGKNTSIQGQSNSTVNISSSQDLNTTQNALDGIDRLVAKVLDELNSANSGNKSIALNLKQAKLGSSTALELNALTKELEGQNDSEILKSLNLKLKNFLKPIAELKAENLPNIIRDSGVGFEAKLANALEPESLPSPILKLLGDIKNLSNKQLFSQILTLANDKDDAAVSFEKLNNILSQRLSQSKEIILQSGAAKILNIPNKLDSISKYLDLKLNSNITAEEAKKINANINKAILSLNNKLEPILEQKEALRSMGFNSNLNHLKHTLSSIKEQLDNIETIGSKTEYLNKFLNLAGSDSNATDTSISGKLKSAARRLSAMLEISHKDAWNAKIDEGEIKGVLKQLDIATKSLNLIKAQNVQQVIDINLSSDIKATLLSIQDELRSQISTPSTQQSLNSVNKILAGIELQQIISTVSGGINSYLPYVWDDVERSSVSFKRGKKDKYYAQIELSFKSLGHIGVLVSLSNKRYIDINMATERVDFKDIINTHSKSLKQAILSVGLTVSSFNVKVMPKRLLEREFSNFDGIKMGLDDRI